MEQRLRAHLVLALALVAGGCGDKGDDSAAGEVASDDYGTCDEGHASGLARVVLAAGSDAHPLDGATLAARVDADRGDDTLCCLEGHFDADTCMAIDDEVWPDFTGVCRSALREAWPTAGGEYWAFSETCGPMWVGEACCVMVEAFLEEDDVDVGRPFLVRARPRIAPPTLRGDWSADLCPAPVPSAARAAVVARWTAAGRMEHASVAAFSRFSLALLHHGAPADLVRDTHIAALDEVRHAEVCFALASAIGGVPVGPGDLDVSSSLDGELDLAQITRTLVAEGCVGETLAALEAAEAARLATDPVVQQVLQGIAEDETRHAALAWRTLAWLLGEDASLRSVAEAALAEAAALRPVSGRPGLEAHGCLSGETRAHIRRVGLETVVAALAAETVGGGPTEARA